MATVINRNGNKIVLLNPSEKGQRYARQLKHGVDHNGVVLSDTQKSFRSGYLQARKDSAKAYNAKQRRK